MKTSDLFIITFPMMSYYVAKIFASNPKAITNKNSNSRYDSLFGKGL